MGNWASHDRNGLLYFQRLRDYTFKWCVIEQSPSSSDLSNLAGTKSQGPHLSFRVLPSTCLRNIWKAKTKHGYHFSYAVKSRRGLTDSFRDQVADFRVFSQQKREYWVTGKMMRRKTMIPSSSIVKMPLLRLCFCSKGNLTIICNDNRGYGLFYATAEPEMRTQMSALPLTAASRRKKFEQFALMMCRIHWKILSSIEL